MKKVVPHDAVMLPDTAECMFKGIIYDTYQWSQELFDGTSSTFEMLKRPDTVSVICVTDKKILVLKDEQPHNGLRLSFPGGRVDKEDPDILAAAQREILEETGYTFNKWRLVKVWQPHTKIEWFVHLYVASELATSVETRLDAGEKITVELMSFDEVKKLVLDKVGYLGEAQSIFENCESISDLMKISNYEGMDVDR